MIFSTLTATAGVVLLGTAFNVWRLNDFGNLDYAHTMRLVIPGTTLVMLGVQTLFWSFFLSILRMAQPRTAAIPRQSAESIPAIHERAA